MFEFIVILVIALVIALLLPYLIWRLLMGRMLGTAVRNFFSLIFRTGSDSVEEVPAEVRSTQPISGLMKDLAESVKTGNETTIAPSPDIPKASIQATTSDIKTNYEPPYRGNPDIIEADLPVNEQSVDSAVAYPVQPLVEDNSFDRDDPIIDSQYIDPGTPSADVLDAHIPEADKSNFGVRFADHSPGRVLRDKRRRRNASS